MIEEIAYCLRCEDWQFCEVLTRYMLRCTECLNVQARRPLVRVTSEQRQAIRDAARMFDRDVDQLREDRMFDLEMRLDLSSEEVEQVWNEEYP